MSAYHTTAGISINKYTLFCIDPPHDDFQTKLYTRRDNANHNTFHINADAE
ncbi:MAG: hypothetical protein WCG25_00650 [bacterium]